MSMHMIVLHKVKDAEMLLEKRSSIYSDPGTSSGQTVRNPNAYETNAELTYL